MEKGKVATVREMMTRKVINLSPDMAVVEAAAVLIKNGISGAPVVDDEGRLLGLVSEFDCLRAVAVSDYEMDSHDAIESVGDLMSREPLIRSVGDLMSREPLTVPPDMDLFTLAHEFVSRRVRRFPVVENGRVIGQVSRRDALKAALVLRKDRISSHPSYPDYPRGRAPIKNYPKG